MPTGLPYQREPKWTWRVMADVPKRSKEREICLFCLKYIQSTKKETSVEPKTWEGHPVAGGGTKRTNRATSGNGKHGDPRRLMLLPLPYTMLVHLVTHEAPNVIWRL